MPLLGSAAMLLSFDIEADAIDEHDRWHTHEHLPERLSIPGFRRGTRWIATEGGPRYMVLYEVESLATLASEAYLARLNHPTPWTTRMMPHYRGMIRGLCTVVGSFGLGQGGTATLIRFSPEASQSASLVRWLVEDMLPAVPQLPGLGGAHLLQGAQMAAMTNEQRIRGTDRGVDTAIIITGYDSHAVEAYVNALCATDGLPARGAGELSCATYVSSYSLASTEIGVSAANPARPMDLTATAVRALMLYSLAEFQSGHATTIRVTAEGGSFSIADDGRGHPLDKTIEGTSYLKFIYTHFDYPFESGRSAPVQLQGIGMSLVNALCSELALTVRKPDETLQLKFQHGQLCASHRTAVRSEENGITVTAKLNPQWKGNGVDSKQLEECLRGVAACHPTLKLFFNGRQLHRSHNGDTHDDIQHIA